MAASGTTGLSAMTVRRRLAGYTLTRALDTIAAATDRPALRRAIEAGAAATPLGLGWTPSRWPMLYVRFDLPTRVLIVGLSLTPRGAAAVAEGGPGSAPADLTPWPSDGPALGR